MFACWDFFFNDFWLSDDFFSNLTFFQKCVSSVSKSLDPDWVRQFVLIVCKAYHQTTLAGKELNVYVQHSDSMELSVCFLVRTIILSHTCVCNQGWLW